MARAAAAKHLLFTQPSQARWAGRRRRTGGRRRKPDSSICSAHPTSRCRYRRSRSTTRRSSNRRRCSKKSSGPASPPSLATPRRPAGSSSTRVCRSIRSRSMRCSRIRANGRKCASRARRPTAPMFHGQAGAVPVRAWSVSAIETYLQCPFRFFAQHVLRLEEDPDDDEVMDPRQQGQFMHQVFEAFFKEWQDRGYQAIVPDNLDQARDGVRTGRRAQSWRAFPDRGGAGADAAPRIVGSRRSRRGGAADGSRAACRCGRPAARTPVGGGVHLPDPVRTAGDCAAEERPIAWICSKTGPSA